MGIETQTYFGAHYEGLTGTCQDRQKNPASVEAGFFVVFGVQVLRNSLVSEEVQPPSVS